MPPEGDWYTWLIRAGRGFGKTRAGGGWVHARAIESPGRWMALVAKTPADARDYMIEGPGGILKNTHREEMPLYEPSKRRLTWPNGSWATIYSDQEPDQLRGFSGDTAWLDEFAKFRNPRLTWDNLMFGMREASSDRPRVAITTTPRPIKILIEIQKAPTTVMVIGDSYENRANLDPYWFNEVLSQYEGTRLGRQELYAEILEDNPDALWIRDDIEQHRLTKAPELSRIVVAIDPQAKDSETSAETGIVVAGKGTDGRGYVLDDMSTKSSPEGWGKAAVTAYHKFRADRIIGEANNGGDMVEHVVRTVDQTVPFKQVHASRGKQLRAEPISALYEQGKISHVGMFGDLEDQMLQWVPGDKSPDRLDALVWALTELMLGKERRTKALGRKPAGL